jgi:hypothetical protein
MMLPGQFSETNPLGVRNDLTNGFLKDNGTAIPVTGCRRP